jgi:hypothetical protein
MLKEAHPDLVIGFRSNRASRGTNDMLARAWRAGISTIVIDRPGAPARSLSSPPRGTPQQGRLPGCA